MFLSLHKKISTLVHQRQNKIDIARGIVSGSVNIALSHKLVQGDAWDFTIIFTSAKHLPRGDLLSSDPFLEAYLGSPEDQETLSFVTGVQWATLDPTWDATWNLQHVKEGTALEILVKDKNKMMVDTDLGRASIILGARLEGAREHVVDIWLTDNSKHGQLFIQITGVRSSGKSAELTGPSTSGPARYSRHTSYAAGVLLPKNMHEFHTYRVRLYHLFQVFGSDPKDYQHWNTDYDASKRIFADNLEGLNIRNALHSQHSYLYRHGHNTSYGALQTGEDFGMLVHQDRLKKDPNFDLASVLFTYSIVPKGLYFSETGSAFIQDFMSKHAMHANHAREVMYAGEFRIYRDTENNNAWTLLIDNNSGTYAPKKEMLYKLKEAFELNFSDLIVIALDREDPTLKEMREMTKKVDAELVAQHGKEYQLFGGILSKSGQDLLQAHNQTDHQCEV
ncbi:hypothetical protein BGX26_010279 [Mortierella sp. AD094]|nr:hypothetical protein BGX26_010279 [Mortierella sp. AD094]